MFHAQMPPAPPPERHLPSYAWRMAFRLIDQLGPGPAELYAAERYDEMAAGGEENDVRVWRFTMVALWELQRTERTAGEMLH